MSDAKSQFINTGMRATLVDVAARLITDSVKEKKIPDGYTIGEDIVVPFVYDKIVATMLKKFKIDSVLGMIGFDAQYNDVILKFIGEFGLSWLYEYMAGNKETMGYMLLKQLIAQTSSHLSTHM